jgi:hypothetical protein
MSRINTAETITYFAWDTSAQDFIAGDEANHTLSGSADGVGFVPGAAPVQIGATDMYRVVIAAGENTGSMMALGGTSSTADVVLIPVYWTNTSNVVQVEGADATDAIGDAVADEVYEGAMTFREMTRIFLSVLAGLSSGGGTDDIAFRDLANAKNRVRVTVDSSGNRTVIITLDGS